LTAAPSLGQDRRVADDLRPFAVLPGEGATVQGPAGGPLTYKARGEQTGGALTAIENVIAPGEGPPLHVHANEDEAWWVIEGTLRFRLGEQAAEAPAGTFVFVPRGVAHAFQNVGDGPARILVLFTPAGMERFFDTFATLTAGPDAFTTAGREAQMAVVGPPLAVSDPR
jgi:quercetin dioxygenase-like cupin family protein